MIDRLGEVSLGVTIAEAQESLVLGKLKDPLTVLNMGFQPFTPYCSPKGISWLTGTQHQGTEFPRYRDIPIPSGQGAPADKLLPCGTLLSLRASGRRSEPASL